MAAMMEGAVSAALVSGQYAGVIDEFEQHEMIMGEDVPAVRSPAFSLVLERRNGTPEAAAWRRPLTRRWHCSSSCASARARHRTGRTRCTCSYTCSRTICTYRATRRAPRACTSPRPPLRRPVSATGASLTTATLPRARGALARDSVSARFVWKRCVVGKGEDWAADADLQTAFAVLQALWKTEYAAAHAAIDAYLATAAAGAAGMMMGRVLAAVQARLRAQALALVRKGYSSIHISSLGDLLGFAAAGAAAPSREEGALAGA